MFLADFCRADAAHYSPQGITAIGGSVSLAKEKNGSSVLVVPSGVHLRADLGFASPVSCCPVRYDAHLCSPCMSFSSFLLSFFLNFFVYLFSPSFFLCP